MLLIFDLDGTLIDSAEDLAISMNAARAFAGMPPLDTKLIYSYVGSGAATLVRRALGPEVSEETVAAALDYFLRFYRQHALEHTRFYPGIREALDALTSHTLAVLTNKPERISRDMLRALNAADLFVNVIGGDSLPVKKPNPAGIVALCDQTGIDVSETLMIGDSSIDILTARNAGARSCGAKWGFQPESFHQEPPDFAIDHPMELPALVERLQFTPASR